ncbi:adenosine deaminase [Lysinibacillus sp. 2017]|uniref:adenine deaminase C-terminal domain-containing protein n=1 Tax=unclassified Lysinibacillus TaxID=2636778 RepID=UPI000D528FB2|nr:MULTISPECIES: adenine deaminase C-terminal domain-containing protein [unclassified Lysinibacillus]AWE08839.1 adenosine deaminase [Lysinibacillus sp. 2017]TGN36162.1 adenine deaminase [Lysinibacillus sp. S2017]
MPEIKWKINNIREQVSIIDGHAAPDMVLQNAKYLHSILKQWVTGNIWISGERIVYAGKEMPLNIEGTEVVDLVGKTVVPGYIEPHVHPFQLYNPHSFAEFSAQSGTTTFISDNMTFVSLFENKKAFTFLDELSELPFSFYWWARFDSQTELENEGELYSNASVLEWLDRQDVLLGGELTGWPRLMRGDDQMLYWIQAAKHKGKKIEAHLPGASEKTLTKMRLFGADGDHESMTIEDIEMRLLHGYAVTLRYSSIRPDLPQLLKDVVDKGYPIFDHLMMTTDGSTPSFHEDGVIDKCIRAALESGVSPIDAYNMASYNVARYYNMTNLHGLIATGRYANINILTDEYSPTPEAVLSKGVWLKRNNEDQKALPAVDFSVFGQLNIDYDLYESDFQFSMPIGIEMVNDVITKPYSVKNFGHNNVLLTDNDESYLMLVDRNGKWRINTMIKGFSSKVKGFASSYSNTGDIILIGKTMKDMKHAFEELKKMNGGIILVEDGQVVSSIPLTIAGSLYDGTVDELIPLEVALKAALKERGYHHTDAIYTLLFLQSTHLPYIRITTRGIFDVMKNTVMLPAVMR